MTTPLADALVLLMIALASAVTAWAKTRRKVAREDPPHGSAPLV